MKYILSWGGGVNSTAILAMIKLGMLPRFTKDNSVFVFADVMGEMPYTYEHTNICFSILAKEGWQVKVISPHKDQKYYTKRCQNKGLFEYCMENTVMPSRVNRWCTMEYKSKPIKEFRKEFEETILVLGISVDEKHRAKAKYAKDTCYPLIEHEIDRQGCIDLTKEVNLPAARKSGCYFCPFQRKAQWLELYRKYPDLFSEVQKLEDNARIKYDGKAYYFIRDLRLTEQIEKWVRKDCSQQIFEDMGLDQSCFCAD